MQRADKSGLLMDLVANCVGLPITFATQIIFEEGKKKQPMVDGDNGCDQAHYFQPKFSWIVSCFSFDNISMEEKMKYHV